jgi:hypothetical protein
MHTFDPALCTIDVQPTMPKVDLRPTKLAKLLRTQAMSIGEEDRSAIA